MDDDGFSGYELPASGGSGFTPIGNNGYGVQPMGSTPLGGDLHETFGVNEHGDVYDGHTTVRISGGHSVRLDWD